MAGKEAEQKVLSASLLCQGSGDPKMFSLLRKEIVKGRLGTFQVVAFPDKFEGLFPIYLLLFKFLYLHLVVCFFIYLFIYLFTYLFV